MQQLAAARRAGRPERAVAAGCAISKTLRSPVPPAFGDKWTATLRRTEVLHCELIAAALQDLDHSLKAELQATCKARQAGFLDAMDRAAKGFRTRILSAWVGEDKAPRSRWSPPRTAHS